MPAPLHDIRAAGVGPVDMAQAAIGPGMAVFSRYKAVLEDSGEPMAVRTALALINQIRDEIDHDDDAAYDAETRFALDWFGEAGWEYRDSGRAILLANAKNLAHPRLVQLGLIEAPGGPPAWRRATLSTYRLYGLAERKGWAQEALVWNRLAEEWGAIEAIAEGIAAGPPARGATPDLFGARP
jgi:putative DNA methylase